jgi:hypothetical protein
VVLAVATRHDAAAARGVALHQLTCHMCHAWTLLYGCCWLMLLPSLLAWLQLPLGESPVLKPCLEALHFFRVTNQSCLGCSSCAAAAATL